MKTTTTKNTPNYSDDMTTEQWAELESYLVNHQELDADDINELVYEMVANGKKLVIDEKVKDRNELIAEQAKEIETLKAQLADKALIIAELNTVVHELKVQQGNASRQAEWDSSAIGRKTRANDRKKRTIENLNSELAKLKDNAIHQEQVIEDISRTAKVRLENYNILQDKYSIVTAENTSLRETLKAVL